MVLSTDAPTPDTVSTNGSSTRTLDDHQVTALVEWTNNQLLEIVRRHFNTQYATHAPSLSAFRDAVSAHDGIEVDATLLADFCAHVPLSNYDSYKPFVDRFNTQPCKKDDVENLFSPGFPEFLSISSATSAKTPKLLARYTDARLSPSSWLFDSNSQNPLAAVVYCGSISVKEIVDGSGRVVERIPVCLASGQMDVRHLVILRCAVGGDHFPSFLTIHALFFLLPRDVDRFYVPFSTLFLELIRYIDKQWDTLVSCIENGTLPDLEGIDHVRELLQAPFYADPERATELSEIGPPFSFEGWASRVWPNLTLLCTVCTGPWVMMLPSVRSILGPDILIRTPGYGTSESMIGSLHDVNKPDEFIIRRDKVTEFLDVSQGDSLENLRQAWEVEVGKQYEPIITTAHGLWRYHMGDIVTVIGFHRGQHSPIFKILGRKSMKIHLPHVQIADFQLLEAIRISSSEDTIVVQEFTTVVDDRASTPTVGFIVELAKSPGPNAHLAPQKLYDALVATDAGQICLPTIRIVKPGTFSEYRLQRAKSMNFSSGQIKLPSVLVDPDVQKWILERVDQEL